MVIFRREKKRTELTSSFRYDQSDKIERIVQIKIGFFQERMDQFVYISSANHTQRRIWDMCTSVQVVTPIQHNQMKLQIRNIFSKCNMKDMMETPTSSSDQQRANIGVCYLILDLELVCLVGLVYYIFLLEKLIWLSRLT